MCRLFGILELVYAGRALFAAFCPSAGAPCSPSYSSEFVNSTGDAFQIAYLRIGFALLILGVVGTAAALPMISCAQRPGIARALAAFALLAILIGSVFSALSINTMSALIPLYNNTSTSDSLINPGYFGIVACWQSVQATIGIFRMTSD